jgi:DNA-binding CsgD family transcriptional regulator
MNMSENAKVVTFGSQDWFRRLGNTSLALGMPNFHEYLIELLGCLIDHSARWIIRFSDSAAPEIMYTHGVSQNLLDYYRDFCSAIDPFAAHWRLHREVGVRTLSRFHGMMGTIDARSYRTAFMPAANISDELGLFLPTIGQSSIGDFSEREMDCARAAFPILSSLERAHISRVFEGMRHSSSKLQAAHLNPQPTLVQDRYGVEIFSSPSWRAAIAQAPALEAAVQKVGLNGPVEIEGFTLYVQRSDKYFPLAPGGRMLTLALCSGTDEERCATRERTELLRHLTPRERDIFNLILVGQSTSDISQLLSLSKGTVKNVTLRIYKKAGVDSKRALIQRYALRDMRQSMVAE